MTLTDKNILIGVCGSIAAYKVADWARNLKREGADIHVVMTESGARFITPLTFAALTGNKVHTDMFDSAGAEEIPHISLARKSDLVLIAPATAQTIARLAHGLADDLLSTLTLAAEAKVLVFPAMNSKMYQHPATQGNLSKLREYGYFVIEPDSGSMACGETGPGRLVEWPAARHAIFKALCHQDLIGQKVLVTAGPTREPLDPARFLSNRSSGKMGYAIAAAAAMRGADVTLVSGPTNLSPPPGVNTLTVQTAEEMHKAVLDNAIKATLIIKAAAVADFRPAITSDSKVKKDKASDSIKLQSNPDILKDLGELKGKRKNQILIGFAAESHDHVSEGTRKLKEKNLDLIVVNDIIKQDSGFESDTNRAIIIDEHGGEEKLPLLSKEQTAHKILDRAAKIFQQQ